MNPTETRGSSRAAACWQGWRCWRPRSRHGPSSACGAAPRAARWSWPALPPPRWPPRPRPSRAPPRQPGGRRKVGAGRRRPVRCRRAAGRGRRGPGQGQPDQDAAAEARRAAVAVRPEAHQRCGLPGGEDQDPQPDDAIARPDRRAPFGHTDGSNPYEIQTQSVDGGIGRRAAGGPADPRCRRRRQGATDVRAKRRKPQGRRQDACAW